MTPRRTLALALAAAAAFAAPASADAPELPDVKGATDCVKQYVIVAEPAVRPVRLEPDGSIGIYPSEVTVAVNRTVTRTLTLASCLAS